MTVYGTMGSLLVVTMLVAVAKRLPLFIGKTIKIFIMILFLDISGIVWGVNAVTDVSSAMLWIGIVSTISTMLLIFCLHIFTNIYNEYTHGFLNISKMLRYMLLPGVCVWFLDKRMEYSRIYPWYFARFSRT